MQLTVEEKLMVLKARRDESTKELRLWEDNYSNRLERLSKRIRNQSSDIVIKRRVDSLQAAYGMIAMLQKGIENIDADIRAIEQP